MDQRSDHSVGSYRYSEASARRLLFVLLAVEAILIAAYIFSHIIAPEMRLGPIRNFVNVDREVSVPTWFSSVQLFTVSLVLWNFAREAGELRRFFLILGSVFLFLSLDESAGLHEALFRVSQERDLAWGMNYLAWMVPYFLVGILGVALGCRPITLIARRYPGEGLWVAGGAALFVGGGVAIEILTHRLYVIGVDRNFFLAVAAEEFCEMTGVSVILYGILLLGLQLPAPSFTPSGADQARPNFGSV